MSKIPLANYIDNAVDWMQDSWGPALDILSEIQDNQVRFLTEFLSNTPWWLIVAIIGLIAWKASSIKLCIGSVLGLFLINNLELWEPFIETLVLVIWSAVISMIIGFPLGILSGKKNGFNSFIMPILDFMQTMPSFVYLIPALLLFGIGKVPAIFATVIFAMPPVIRLTDLGIRQVPTDLIEVGETFGCTTFQMLWKIQLPVAIPTIMTGVNQTMMLALSMVVISAMIGAGGLGAGVLESIAQLKNGQGFEFGIAVVIMAIILDRILQGLGKSLQVDKDR
jgi:glycine betaine/proline transport system permease protein